MIKLKELMKQHNISQSDIILRTGLSKTVVSLLVNNKRPLTMQYAKKLAPLFNVTPSYLLGLDDTQEELLIPPPGETLFEVMIDRGMSGEDLAKKTNFSPAYISAVTLWGKDITPDFANALEKVFDIPATYWLNLQSNYNKEIASYTTYKGIETQGGKVNHETLKTCLNAKLDTLDEVSLLNILIYVVENYGKA